MIFDLVKKLVDTHTKDSKTSEFDPDDFEIKVVSFNKEHKESIAKMIEADRHYFTCRVEHEKGNPHDPDAMRVFVFLPNKEKVCVGYIPRDRQHDMHVAFNYIRGGNYYTSLEFIYSVLDGSTLLIHLRESART